MEVRLRCGVLARLYQLLANATTGARGVHEERANARGVASRVEQRVVVRGPVAIPAEQRLALTPSATANDALAVVFHDKIGTVDDELAVDSEYRAERALDLCRRIIRRLQHTYRQWDQLVERRDIAVLRQTKRHRHRRQSSTRADQLRRLGYRLGFHPKDSGKASIVAGDRIHGSDVDLCRCQRLEHTGHGAHAILALEQEASLARAELQLECLGGALERGGVFGNQVELTLAPTREAGERKQVYTLGGKPRQDFRTLTGRIGNHHVVVVDFAYVISHGAPPFDEARVCPRPEP